MSFKRKTSIREKITDKVIIRYNEIGWMNEEIMCEWLQTVFNNKSMPILDSIRSTGKFCPFLLKIKE